MEKYITVKECPTKAPRREEEGLMPLGPIFQRHSFLISISYFLFQIPHVLESRQEVRNLSDEIEQNRHYLLQGRNERLQWVFILDWAGNGHRENVRRQKKKRSQQTT